MKTNIMQSLKKFGCAALVAATVMSTAAVAASADEVGSEEDILLEESVEVEEEALEVVEEEPAEEEVLMADEIEVEESVSEDAAMAAEKDLDDYMDDVIAAIENGESIRNILKLVKLVKAAGGSNSYIFAELDYSEVKVSSKLMDAIVTQVMGGTITYVKGKTEDKSSKSDNSSSKSDESGSNGGSTISVDVNVNTGSSDTAPAAAADTSDTSESTTEEKGLLDYIKDIIGIVDSGATATDKVVDVADKIMGKLGLKSAPELAEKMAETLKAAGVSFDPNTLLKAAETVVGTVSKSTSSDSTGTGTNSYSGNNGIVIINNGGTVYTGEISGKTQTADSTKDSAAQNSSAQDTSAQVGVRKLVSKKLMTEEAACRVIDESVKNGALYQDGFKYYNGTNELIGVTGYKGCAITENGIRTEKCYESAGMTSSYSTGKIYKSAAFKTKEEAESFMNQMAYDGHLVNATVQTYDTNDYRVLGTVAAEANLVYLYVYETVLG